jgi:hypothetical protein
MRRGPVADAVIWRRRHVLIPQIDLTRQGIILKRSVSSNSRSTIRAGSKSV